MARPAPLPTILLLGSFLFAAAGCAGSPRAHDLIGSWTRLAVEGGGPGPRLSPLSWTDSTGTLWMFAGEGPEGFLTDMWRFDGNKWAPVKGARPPLSPRGGCEG